MLLGTDTDKAIAHQIGKSVRAVSKRRARLGIKPFRRPASHIERRDGYIYEGVSIDDPLRCMSRNKRGLVAQHRLVMARHIGRPLTVDETVHHRNGIRDDNRLDNLELWVKQHQPGQRVTDLLAFAHEILERYGSEEGFLTTTSTTTPLALSVSPR